MDSRQNVAIDIMSESSPFQAPLVTSPHAGSQPDCLPSLSPLRRLEPALSRIVPDFFLPRRDAPRSQGWYDLFVMTALAVMIAMGAVTAAMSRNQTIASTALGNFDPSATTSVQVIAPVFRYEQYDENVQISFDWEPKYFAGPQDCLNVSAVFQRVTTQDLNALVNFSASSSLASWVVGAFEHYPNQPKIRSIFTTLQQRLSGVTLNYMGCGHYDALASCGFDPYRMCSLLNDSFVPHAQEVFFRVGATQFTATTLSMICNQTVHSFLRGDQLLDRFANISVSAEHPSNDFVQCVLDRMQTCVTSFNYTKVCTDVFAHQDPPRFLNTYETHPSVLQVIAQVSTIMGISYLGLKFVLAQIYWHWVIPKPST